MKNKISIFVLYFNDIGRLLKHKDRYINSIIIYHSVGKYIKYTRFLMDKKIGVKIKKIFKYEE